MNKTIPLSILLALGLPAYAHNYAPIAKAAKPVFTKGAKFAFTKVKPDFVKVKSVFVKTKSVFTKPPKTLVTKNKGWQEGTNLGDNDGDEDNIKEIEGLRP